MITSKNFAAKSLWVWNEKKDFIWPPSHSHSILSRIPTIDVHVTIFSNKKFLFSATQNTCIKCITKQFLICDSTMKIFRIDFQVHKKMSTIKFQNYAIVKSIFMYTVWRILFPRKPLHKNRMKEFFPSFPLCIYRGKKIAKLKS